MTYSSNHGWISSLGTKILKISLSIPPFLSVLLGAVSVQQCHMLDMQVLSQQQELHGDARHLRLHSVARDRYILHHAVTGGGPATQTGTGPD